MSEDNPVKSKFTLDPTYRNFVPGKTHLKFETLTKMNDLGCGCNVIGIVLLWLPMTVMLLGILVSGIAQDLKFQYGGRDITAAVTECTPSYSRKADTFTYAYTVAGVIYTGKGLLRDHEDCRQYPAGMAVPVRYLVDEAAESDVIRADSNSTIAYLALVGCGIPGMLLMFSFSAYQIRHYRRSQQAYPRLQKGGIFLEGEIIAIHGETGKRGDENYRVNVDYAFTSPGKRRLTGHVEAIRGELEGKELPPVGTPVTILYVDDNAYTML